MSSLTSQWTARAVRGHERRARRLMAREEWEQAAAAYREILNLDPEIGRVHYGLGLCYYRLGRWRDATLALERAVDLAYADAEKLLAEVRAATPVRAADLRPVEPPPPAVIVGGDVVTRSIEPEHGAPDGQPGQIAEPSPVYEDDRVVRRDSGEEVQRPIVCPPLDAIFAPGGALSNLLGDRYRPRAGQVRMANLVREALQERRHAVIEAGTGIGKSFAYLVPVLWSGAPAVVSTSNKGLMNQLWEHDIPSLKRIAPRTFKAALLKGRANYLCALQLKRLSQLPSRKDRDVLLDLIRERLNEVPSGDVEVMRLPPEVAARVTVGSRECRGRHCPEFRNCFYEAAKQKAVEADLVVTNHALLCYSVLLAENHVLPVRPVLIIDEAHQLPRYAVEALTLAFEHDQFWALANSPSVQESVPEEHLDEMSAGYDAFIRSIADQRPGALRSKQRPTRWALKGELQSGLALWETLRRVQRSLSHAKGLNEGDREAALRQNEEIAAAVHGLATPEPETHIRLCDFDETTPPGSSVAYQAALRPLEVALPLRRLLFDVWPRVLCTSATLSVGNDLGWFQRQVGLFDSRGVDAADDGLPSVISEALSGPFDYARQMLIYTPRALTPVYDEARQAFAHDYVRQLTAEVERLLEASRGRALVLCTSRARMAQLHDALAPVLADRYPCYLQGDLAQPELVARFKADGNAILFATRGFWEGLDIPGDALALVVLDKVPFVPYDDPVIRRQEARIAARGGNSFYEIQLGPAILNLRQGVGRLIRSETDRGVIALLDGRVLRRAYGRQILESLPGGRRTTTFEDVAAFFDDSTSGLS
ncbi:MAG: helicase C-terminal domain-containing protein [Anaerolineae bacterium]